MGEVDHHEYTVAETTDILARSAAAVGAAGTCSSYGGVPAARGQQTQAVSVSQLLKMRGIPTPVITMFLVFIVSVLFLNRTRIGRHIYAVGGNDLSLIHI